MRFLISGVLALLLGSLEIDAATVNAKKHSSSFSTDSQSQQPPQNNHVYWQAVFWALLSLALNAMTQNSTLDRDFPSTVLFPARSSPVICFMDTIEILLRLFAYVYTRASAPAAARLVVRERLLRLAGSDAKDMAAVHDDTADNAGMTGYPPAVSDQHPKAHIILFTLAPLPQAIRLFGMSGIPWSQACGAIYLSSFLVVAGVGVLARRAGEYTSPSPALASVQVRCMTMLNWRYDLAVIVIHTRIWAWFTSELLDPNWTLDVRGNLHLIYWTFCYSSLFILYFFAMLPMMFILAVVIDEPPFLRIMSLPFLGLIMYGTARFMIFVTEEAQRLALWFSVWIFSFLATRMVSHQLLMISFALINLILLILYNRFRYDSADTNEPQWLKALG